MSASLLCHGMPDHRGFSLDRGRWESLQGNRSVLYSLLHPKDYIETLKKYQLHNLYIKIASEYGILTFMAFFLFLSALGKDVFSSLLSLKGERFWLLAGAGGSVVVWLLHNLVDEGFNFMAIQWSVLLGLAVSMKGFGSPNGEKWQKGNVTVNVA